MLVENSHIHDIITVFKESSLFYPLKIKDMVWLARRGRLISVEADESLNILHKEKSFVSVILEGEVQVTRRSQEGECFEFTLTSGFTFGRIDFFLNFGNILAVKPKTKCSLICFDETDITLLLTRSFEAQYHLELLHQSSFPLKTAVQNSTETWNRLQDENLWAAFPRGLRKTQRVDVTTWNLLFYTQKHAYRIKDISIHGLGVYDAGTLSAGDRIEGQVTGLSLKNSKPFSLQGHISRNDGGIAGIALGHHSVVERIHWAKCVNTALGIAKEEDSSLQPKPLMISIPAAIKNHSQTYACMVNAISEQRVVVENIPHLPREGSLTLHFYHADHADKGAKLHLIEHCPSTLTFEMKDLSPEMYKRIQILISLKNQVIPTHFM